MIDKLNFNISRTGNRGIFHDSRGDVRTLTKALNIAIDKINELVYVVNRQDIEVKEIKENVENEIIAPPPEGPPLRTGY